jgi:hypothetical protein
VRASIAILIATFSAAVPAQQLGSLFHSPKERETLERLRRGESVTQAAQAALARPDPVLTGYVKRSDGKSTVFLDKKPHSIRNVQLQERLEPRAVDRYDPVPWTPPPGSDKPVASAKPGEED